MISRRNVLLGSAAILGVNLLPEIASSSGQSKSTLVESKPSQNSVSLRYITSISVPEPVPQGCENWCWAACLESLFLYSGYKVSQTRIVKHLSHGRAECRTATPAGIYLAGQNDWVDDHNKVFISRSAIWYDKQFGGAFGNFHASIVKQLLDGKPLIIGAIGHATVLHKIDWVVNKTYDNNGLIVGEAYKILRARVMDPYLKIDANRLLTDNELRNTSYIGGVEIYP